MLTYKPIIKHPVIVIGSTGYIGRYFSRYCKKLGVYTIGVSRSHGDSCDHNLHVDFANPDELDLMWQTISKEYLAKCAIVFCQRYRHPNMIEASSINNSFNVEIEPYLSLGRFLTSSPNYCKINLVTITSNSSARFATDIEPSYHVIKHAQVAAAQSLAYLNCKSDIYSNILSFGDLKNSWLLEHSPYHVTLHSHIRRIQPKHQLPSIRHLLRLTFLLCNSDSFSLSGQTIVVDGGLSMMTTDGVIRTISKPHD